MSVPAIQNASLRSRASASAEGATASTFAARRARGYGERIWTFAFCAALLHTFVEYVRPQERYALISGLPLGQVSLIFLLLGAFVSRPSLARTGPITGFATAFMAWPLVPALLSDSPSQSLEVYWEALKVLAVYFFLAASIRNPRQIYIFVCWLLLIYFQHTNFSFRGWLFSGGQAAGSYVGSGFLNNPNDFGAALASFWGMSLLLAFHDPNRIRGVKVRWLHAFGTLLFCFAALATSSRGTFVALAASGLYYGFAYTKGFGGKLLGLCVVLLGVGGFLYMLSPQQAERFEGMGGAEDDTAQDRLRTWSVAWEVFKDNPVFGVGPGRFLPVANAGYGGDGGPIFVQHNIFLQALTDLGAIGFLLLLGLLAAVFLSQRQLLRLLRKPALEDGDDQAGLLRALVIGTSVSLVGFLVNGQFITVLFYPFFWILLVIAAALRAIVLESWGRSASMSSGRYGSRSALS